MLRHEFAAMIFDIRMPQMGGIELANLVKQRRRTQDVPIIFLTAHTLEDEDVLRAYGVGAVDYLSKPVNADILCSKVSVFVDLYRKTRALAILNHELQREVSARQKAQEALQQVNQELELRVAERTAALTIAHRGVKENEERLRMAMDVAADRRLGVGRRERSHDVVDRAGSAVRIPGRVVWRGPAHVTPCCIPTTASAVSWRSRRRRGRVRPTSASTVSFVPMAGRSGSPNGDGCCTRKAGASTSSSA